MIQLRDDTEKMRERERERGAQVGLEIKSQGSAQGIDLWTQSSLNKRAARASR